MALGSVVRRKVRGDLIDGMVRVDIMGGGRIYGHLED